MKKFTSNKSDKPRNYVVRNPLLKKGGAHVKAKSGVRFKGKQKMLREVRERNSSCDTLTSTRIFRAFQDFFSLSI